MYLGKYGLIVELRRPYGRLPISRDHIYRIHSNRCSCPNRRSPPLSSSSWHSKIGEIDDFCIKNAWISGQILRPSLCTNFMSCSRSLCYYWNEYGIMPPRQILSLSFSTKYSIYIEKSCFTTYSASSLLKVNTKNCSL